MNISGFPAHQTTEADKKTPLLTLNNPASKCLADALQNLSIHHVNLPLTIDGLNKTKFSPKSVSENLEAGVLQLVDGTVLLVDETVLDEGQLVDPGVRNFQALQNVIQNQTLTYEFPYSQYDFDTDISVLSLSCTRSMLAVSLCIVNRRDKAVYLYLLWVKNRIIALFLLNPLIHWRIIAQRIWFNLLRKHWIFLEDLFMQENMDLMTFLTKFQR